MRYEDLYTLIAWMKSPYENSGEWTTVNWWGQEMPKGMADAMIEVCEVETRDALIELRDTLPSMTSSIAQLEETWGKLPIGELRRHLDTDLFVIEHLDSSIGMEDNPLGTFSNLKKLLDFVIDFDLTEEA